MKVYQLISETKIRFVLGGDVRKIPNIKTKIKEHYKIEIFHGDIVIAYDSISNTSIVEVFAKDIEPCEIEL